MYPSSASKKHTPSIAMMLASAYRILSLVLIVEIIFFRQQVLPSAMVLLRSRDHRTYAWFFLAVVIITRTHTTKLHRKTQIKTHTHTHSHTQRKKERRASACGFPNPNSVVELKGGRHASVFSFFLFFFFGETSPNFDMKNLISTYLL